MIAPHLDSSLVNPFKPENGSKFKLIKDHNSFRKKDFLINGGVPVNLYSNMLTFRDSIKPFKLDGDNLGTITNFDFNVDHFNPQDQNYVLSLEKK